MRRAGAVNAQPTPEPAWFAALTQEVQDLLHTYERRPTKTGPEKPSVAEGDFITIANTNRGRRRRQHLAPHGVASTGSSPSARAMAFQLGLVLMGMKRAYLLDRPLPAPARQSLPRLARILAVDRPLGPLGRGPQQGKLVILCLRPERRNTGSTPGEGARDQVFVVNTGLIPLGPIQPTALPPVIRVCGTPHPQVVTAEGQEVRSLAATVSEVQKTICSILPSSGLENGPSVLDATAGGKSRKTESLGTPLPIILLRPVTDRESDGGFGSGMIGPHLPALAGWLLEYPVLYTLTCDALNARFSRLLPFAPDPPAWKCILLDPYTLADVSSASGVQETDNAAELLSAEDCQDDIHEGSANNLCDQNLAVLRLSLHLPWLSAEDDVISFSVPLACLGKLDMAAGEAKHDGLSTDASAEARLGSEMKLDLVPRDMDRDCGGKDQEVLDCLMEQLKQRYLSRLTTEPVASAWPGGRVCVHKELVRLSHVTL